MKEALVNGQPILASPDAPKVATCPACGHLVGLRRREDTWFWRHRQGGPQDCPARGSPNKRKRAMNEASHVTDPALAENLAGVCEMLNEIGAKGTWILRGVGDVDVGYAANGERLTLALADAGLFLVARFPASDGVEAGIESR